MKVVELKREMDTQFAEVRSQFSEVNALFRAVDARFNEVDSRFKDVDARFDALESRLTSEHETTRRYLDVLIEQLKAEYRLGLDKMTAIEQRLAGSIASNASEHAAFTAVLQNHELRITGLEAKDEPAEPPSSI